MSKEYDSEKKDLYWQIAGLECKLKQYKDIEDQLGIDLITLFKILKMFDDSIRNGQHGESYVSFLDGTTFTTDMGYIEEFINRFKKLIKDYGKTWALTKEELL